MRLAFVLVLVGALSPRAHACSRLLPSAQTMQTALDGRERIPLNAMIVGLPMFDPTILPDANDPSLLADDGTLIALAIVQADGAMVLAPTMPLQPRTSYELQGTRTPTRFTTGAVDDVIPPDAPEVLELLPQRQVNRFVWGDSCYGGNDVYAGGTEIGVRVAVSPGTALVTLSRAGTDGVTLDAGGPGGCASASMAPCGLVLALLLPMRRSRSAQAARETP